MDARAGGIGGSIEGISASSTRIVALDLASKDNKWVVKRQRIGTWRRSSDLNILERNIGNDSSIGNEFVLASESSEVNCYFIEIVRAANLPFEFAKSVLDLSV